MTTVRIGLAQINTAVGNLPANAARILDAARWASEHRADALLTPELGLTGYPAEDLLIRPAFIDRQLDVLDRLRGDLARFRGLHVIVGHVRRDGNRLYNSASVMADGRVVATYDKHELPNYAVFDEKRYFAPGAKPAVFDLRGLKCGVGICEDTWFPDSPAKAAARDAKVWLVLNASPFTLAKQDERIRQAATNAQGMATVYLNKVGGQDELVFDGASFVLDARGRVVKRLPVFEECLDLVEFDSLGEPALAESPAQWPDEPEQVWRALVLAVRDYLAKTGFSKVVLGLSGGIDSAVVLAVAVDALGADKVRAVMMPSRYTADMSLADARQMADTLGVAYDEIGISSLATAFDQALAPQFAGLPLDATEENIQARIRGILLMALSNKTGALVLSTGNKSELATGYCTLYGDMAGGFAVIKDVPKTLVYRLARWRNGVSSVIPQRIIDRAPSAELRPDQTDQDSLPPYDVLDAIVERYVEHNEPRDDIVRSGFDADVVDQILRLIRINEYKRRQGAPGPKITTRAFGRDWRFPIANGFRE
ncbi:MAG TPA: NAD+ synthase [Burkholderiaceae bacterium]|nr:NAD+ synthase [Burkholderiaceae bacterium]